MELVSWSTLFLIFQSTSFFIILLHAFNQMQFTYPSTNPPNPPPPGGSLYQIYNLTADIFKILYRGGESWQMFQSGHQIAYVITPEAKHVFIYFLFLWEKLSVLCYDDYIVLDQLKEKPQISRSINIFHPKF